jgi:catechol 2,3-dioxygenase-like lactoylglutathione lyase family enzyme
MSAPPRLAVHHLAVVVRDLERAEAFYAGVLGLPVAQRWADEAGAPRSVWLSLVVKSRDPDLKYDGPGARGVLTLDSTAKSMSDATITGRPYRRRVQSLAISLRNYQ